MFTVWVAVVVNVTLGLGIIQLPAVKLVISPTYRLMTNSASVMLMLLSRFTSVAVL